MGQNIRDQDMLDLHYWPTPNGKKVTIQLEECGLDYNIIECNIGKGDQFTDEFLAINPNNRMPTLVWIMPLMMAVDRSRFLNLARSCSTSRRRLACSCPPMREASTRWCNGSYGRWLIKALRPGNAGTFAV